MIQALSNRGALLGLLFLAATFGAGRLGLPPVLLAAVAMASAAVGVWVLLRARPAEPALWLGVAVAVAMAVAPMLALLRGMPADTSQLAWAIGVGVSTWVAALMPPAVVRWAALVALALVAWAGIVAGLLAIAGVFSYGLYDIPAQDRALFGLTQLRGVMPHPNTMGIFAGLGVALGVRQVITDRRDGVLSGRRLAGLALLTVIPCLLALVWSQSRTSAVSAGVGLLVAFLPLENRPTSRWPVAIAAVAGLMITVPVVVSETIGYDFNGRGFPWMLAQRDFEASPLWGAGPDFLDRWYPQFPQADWFPTTAHNMLMQAIGEAGLIGLIALGALVLAMCVVAVQALPFDRQWALIIVVTFCLLGGQESSLSLPVRSALVLQFAVLGSSAALLSRRDRLVASGRTTPAGSPETSPSDPPGSADPAPTLG